jgi:superfamily I DNA and/or RNA helicase
MEDLLTFVRPNFGSKVIFVGNPAQLPPVGESISNALRAEYFSPKSEKISKKIHFPPDYMPYFQRKTLSL